MDTGFERKLAKEIIGQMVTPGYTDNRRKIKNRIMIASH